MRIAIISLLIRAMAEAKRPMRIIHILVPVTLFLCIKSFWMVAAAVMRQVDAEDSNAEVRPKAKSNEMKAGS